jgi:hypothetical protein
MRKTAVLLIGTVIGGPGALAQTKGTSGAGVQGLPGNNCKAGTKTRAVNPAALARIKAKCQDYPENKSGPAPKKASK